MKDPNKHYVVVDTSQVEEYLLRGYARSFPDNIREHVPDFVKDPAALGLVLMETGKAEFEASQRPLVRYAARLDHFTYLRGVDTERLDVLAEDDESGAHTFVGKGNGAARVRTASMFETRREAVVSVAVEIREAIEAHRQAADDLEFYLKGYGL